MDNNQLIEFFDKRIGTMPRCETCGNPNYEWSTFSGTSEYRMFCANCGRQHSFSTDLLMRELNCNSSELNLMYKDMLNRIAVVNASENPQAN